MSRVKAKTGFDQYVQARMGDRKCASAYREARAEIDAVDGLMRQLDDARKAEDIRLPRTKVAGSEPGVSLSMAPTPPIRLRGVAAGDRFLASD